MVAFASSEQLYRCLEALFDRLREQEAAMRPLVSSRLIVRLTTNDPGATVTVNARLRPVRVTYGPDATVPVLDVSLPADALHEILMDRLSLRVAMRRGLVRVQGPFLKAVVLVDLFHHGQAIYPDVLRALDLP